MKLTLTIAMAMFALAGSALADAAAGKVVYTANCAKCHGDDGAGKAVIAKMLGATMKPLGSAEVKSKSEAELQKDIQQGTGKMKPVKISDAQAKDVIAYIKTLK